MSMGNMTTNYEVITTKDVGLVCEQELKDLFSILNKHDVCLDDLAYSYNADDHIDGISAEADREIYDQVGVLQKAFNKTGLSLMLDWFDESGADAYDTLSHGAFWHIEGVYTKSPQALALEKRGVAIKELTGSVYG